MWNAGAGMDGMLDRAFAEHREKYAPRARRGGMGQAPPQPLAPPPQQQRPPTPFFVPYMGNVPAPIMGAARGIKDAPPGTAGHKVKEGLIAVLGGATLAGLVLGGIWLARRIELGAAKDGKSHIRLDAATLAPVIVVGVVGAALILGARWMNRRFEAEAVAKQIQQLQVQVRSPNMLPPPAAPQFAPGMMDPSAIIDEELRAAQGVPGPFAQPPQGNGAPPQMLSLPPMPL